MACLFPSPHFFNTPPSTNPRFSRQGTTVSSSPLHAKRAETEAEAAMVAVGQGHTSEK